MSEQLLFTWRNAVLSAAGPKSPTTRLTLVAVSMHMSPEGDRAWPSIDTLVKRTGLSKRAVQDHLKRAEDEGWLLRGWHGPPNHSLRTYQATFPKAKGGRTTCAVQEVHGGTMAQKGVQLTTKRGAGGAHELDQELDQELDHRGAPPAPAAQRRPLPPVTDLGQQLVDAYPHPTNGQRAATRPSAQQVEVWLMNLRYRRGVTLNPLDPEVQQQILAGAHRAADVARKAPEAYRRGLKTWINDLGWTEQVMASQAPAPPVRRERPTRTQGMTDQEYWADYAARQGQRTERGMPAPPKPRRRS